MANTYVCSHGDIPDGGARIVMVDDREIAVLRAGSDYYAYRNVCPHQGGPACEGIRMAAVRDVVDEHGMFRGQTFDEKDMHIVCPWHGYEFHLNTGAHVIDPGLRLRKYDVELIDGAVYLRD